MRPPTRPPARGAGPQKGPRTSKGGRPPRQPHPAIAGSGWRGPPGTEFDQPQSLTKQDLRFARSLVLHEDAAVLAFDKPPGLAVQTRSPDDLTLDKLLWAFARSNGKRPRLVHRIDRETSGVIIAAKTQPAAARLSEAFAGRTAEKTYLALAAGQLPAAETGLFDQPLRRVQTRPGQEFMRACAPGDTGALAAETGFEVLARHGKVALLRLSPRTGRMHQIRVHLAEAGCPILGDTTYGGLKQIAIPGGGQGTVPRILLHAATLSVPHPDGGQLKLSAPVPADFRAVARALLGLEAMPGDAEAQ